MTHICVSKLTINGSDNGLSPGRRQAIIWTNAGILLIEPLGTNFGEILIGIKIFSFTKMRLKISYAKLRSFCSRPQCVNTQGLTGSALIKSGIAVLCVSILKLNIPYVLARDEQVQELQRKLQESQTMKSLQATEDRTYYVLLACRITIRLSTFQRVRVIKQCCYVIRSTRSPGADLVDRIT